ncbi:protein FRA10AC1 homolog [Dendroctonus ponderosae]|nr:protein FRA10AC1 homolog [Dendroctonus ponderosae]XP_048517586.1 protein FRA10AC1 homolog [Dendroctonus ponderosae]XP_048517587.1 protein FRA10AC1 homolog [Dendroctonus ponderosae]AEE63216.1 unknown [Dendroctonus ponderosae]
MAGLRTQMRYLNAYEIHKLIVNEFVLKQPGDTKWLARDSSKDKTDYHVLKENHKFLWDEKEPETWEEQFAKRYYEKLFKEYCIADLSLYKENKVAMRWRIQKEVLSGKGQFICGNKSCGEKNELRSWEVNFAYQEQGERKNALVKIRLCPSCSKKLNHHSKKKEVTRLQRRGNRKEKHPQAIAPSKATQSRTQAEPEEAPKMELPTEYPAWENHKPVETKSREEEIEDYLEDLLI